MTRQLVADLLRELRMPQMRKQIDIATSDVDLLDVWTRGCPANETDAIERRVCYLKVTRKPTAYVAPYRS